MVRKKGQPICGIIKYFQGYFRFQRNANNNKALRFNPVQIGEWMDALLPRNFVSKDTAVVTLADRLGISRGRVIQFLNLTRIPSDLRGRLREMADLTEARLRPMVQMDSAAMRTAVGRVIGPEVLHGPGKGTLTVRGLHAAPTRPAKPI